MAKFLGIAVLAILVSLTSGYRVVQGQGKPDLVWDEWGYDGFYLTYNATGEVLYEDPSPNAFCKTYAEYYSQNSSVPGCNIHQDWYCKGWLGYAIPADWTFKTRAGATISIATTNTSQFPHDAPNQCSFYPSEQLHWLDIFQSGGSGNQQCCSAGKFCIETLGAAPYRRVIFSWHEIPTSEGIHTTQIKLYETTSTLEFAMKKWSSTYRPRLGFEGNWVLSPGYGNPGGNFDGFSARYMKAECPTGTQFPHMQCVSSKRFQTCSNGKWSAPLSCQPGTFCNPDGNQIFCGFSNPLGGTTSTTTGSASTTTTTASATTTTTTTTTTTSTSTTAPLTSGRVTSGRVTSGQQPITSNKLTTNQVVGAAIVIESVGSYQVSVSTVGSGDYWIDTHSYKFGQVDYKTISWGPEYGKQVVKTDGQYDDTVDPTITHVWTILTSDSGTTNFFPSKDQIPTNSYWYYNTTGDARWRLEGLNLGSDFVLLDTKLQVWDSQGNLRGTGTRIGINMLFDWIEAQPWLPQIDTWAPLDYTGSPIMSKVRFEFTARRVNNQPITSGVLPVTTSANNNAACNVGATRCVGTQYQTCQWAYSNGAYVGAWGANQNCAPSTTCHQYGTAPSTYIGCS